MDRWLSLVQPTGGSRGAAFWSLTRAVDAVLAGASHLGVAAGHGSRVDGLVAA